MSKLREMGYLPLAVTPKSKMNVHKEITIPGFSNRVKLTEIAVATRQLATMIDSGLSVVRSLGILGQPGGEQGAGPGLERGPDGGRARLVAVGGVCQVPQDLQRPVHHDGPGRRGGLPSGRGPAGAGFDDGETGGPASHRPFRLDHVPGRGRCRVMVVIFLALLIFIVPVFTKLFASLNAKLPTPTLIVIDISKIILGPGVACRRGSARDRGRAVPPLDQLHAGLTQRRTLFKLKPPVFGPLIHKVSLARFRTPWRR